MRIRLGPMLAASVLAVSLAAPARAQTTEEWYQLHNPPSPVFASGFGYVGPYATSDLGPGTNPQPAQSGPTVDLFCIDFLHDAVFTPFDAFVTPIVGNLDGVSYFGNAGRNNYLKAAYLASLFATTPQANWLALNETIWYIMDGSDGGLLTPDAGFLAAANAHFQDPGIGFDWAVVHSFVPGANQEFLINTTPEPVSSTLLLGGLLGVGAGWLRRRRQRVEA